MGEGTGPEEKDVMALKAARDKAMDEVQALTGKLSALATDIENLKQGVASERAAKAQLESKVTEAKGELAKALETIKSLQGSVDQSKNTGDKLVSLKRKVLVDFYNVPEENVKDKTLEQLDTLEEALKLVGKRPSRFDVSGGGKGSAEPSEQDRLAARYPVMSRQIKEKGGVA